jgi:hypothetical protein
MGRNIVIQIAPESGIVYTWHGCVGLYDFNHGDVIEEDGVITVDWALDPEAGATRYQQGHKQPYMARRLVFVHWDDARLLLPEHQVAAFCAGVNAGARGVAARFGDFPTDDCYQNCAGRPALPPAWSDLVLDWPLDSTLASLEGPILTGEQYPDGAPKARFRGRIDAGRAHGVREGMILWVFDPEGIRGRIIEANGRSGKARLQVRVHSSRKPALPWYPKGYDTELGAWVSISKVREASVSPVGEGELQEVEASADVFLSNVVGSDPTVELHEGAPLRIVGSGRREAIVVAVEETTSEIEVAGHWGDNRSWAPRVGWRVTSWGAGPPP